MRAPGTRADRTVAVLGVLFVIAGVVVLAALSGFAASVAGAVLIGLGAIALVSLIFLLVGESEDRDLRGGR